ncbi:MAG: hypothetical protein M1832_001122 [Thelocarpon impressellum]|nr:MAG: hypothetical protein M1832_001122 [Thelocarpon impressellum]
MAPLSSADQAMYMRLAISEANRSPPKPTNFRVGAVLVHVAGEAANILATGYTLELPGNTHAEQCCLAKYAGQRGVPEERVGDLLPEGVVLFTTMEPCARRLSGNTPCVARVISTRRGGNVGGIERVYVGVKEPETFVGENDGRRQLERAGIECVHVPGFDDEILRIATAGHESVPAADERAG